MAEDGPSTRAQQRLRSRQQLLQIAIARIAERGPTGVSVQDVAASAGLTTGAVYHQFRGRDELVSAASAYALQSSPSLGQLSREARSLETFLCDAARTALELLDDDADAGYRDLVRVHLQLLLAAPHDDEARATITAFMADQIAELAQHVEEVCRRSGEVADAPALAAAYLALLRGFVLVRLADPALAPLGDVLDAVRGLARMCTRSS